jgi:hypothetical protein
LWDFRNGKNELNGIAIRPKGGALGQLLPTSRTPDKNSVARIETMGKGGRAMRSMLGNSGFLFGAGTLQHCQDDSTSWYCKFSKVFTAIMMVVQLAILGFVIYFLVQMYRGGMKGGALPAPWAKLRAM